MMTNDAIGFCGLGLMGSAMVRRLLRAGHDVVVWNRSPGKSAGLAAEGATVAASPQDVADRCERVLLCLTDQDAVEATVFGERGLAGGRALRLLVDHSSILPAAACDFATRLQAATGARWIDAPVSGGTAGVEQGRAVVMAGGEPQDLEGVAQLLAAYAQRVTHLGPVGTGQAAKLCNQTIVATTLAGIAEAMAMAHAAGLEPSRLQAALSGGWADSVLLQVFVPRMAQVPSDRVGTVATMAKDVANVQTAAHAAGAKMPVFEAVHRRFEAALARGLAQQDLSQLVHAMGHLDFARTASDPSPTGTP